jgi:probable F420-dependent oxidoreductase
MRVGMFGIGVGAMASAEAGPIAKLAEELGYNSLWTGEHMVVPSPRPDYFPREPDWAFADPLVHLAYLAGWTTSVELCTGVLLLPQRHPVHLAKELATLDVVSRGRLVAGVGVGHLQEEMRVMGVDPVGRQARSMEFLAAMRTLWNEHRPEFHGQHVSFQGIDAYPRPYRRGGPRIVMGGSSAAALRRAALYADGWYGWGLDPEQTAAAVRAIHKFGTEAHRDLSEFDISLTPLARVDARLVDRYRDAGVDQVVVSIESDDVDSVKRKLERTRPGALGL